MNLECPPNQIFYSLKTSKPRNFIKKHAKTMGGYRQNRRFLEVWRNLTKFDEIWQNFDEIWRNLTKFWRNLTKFDEILTKFDEIWRNLTVSRIVKKTSKFHEISSKFWSFDRFHGIQKFLKLVNINQTLSMQVIDTTNRFPASQSQGYYQTLDDLGQLSKFWSNQEFWSTISFSNSRSWQSFDIVTLNFDNPMNTRWSQTLRHHQTFYRFDQLTRFWPNLEF